ncbi:hypothetical protein BHM03_00004071 [Ensete ventricosum]|nr:hypothetical protein BHM03_00004071 [Ensete ventricosum]
MEASDLEIRTMRSRRTQRSERLRAQRSQFDRGRATRSCTARAPCRRRRAMAGPASIEEDEPLAEMYAAEWMGADYVLTLVTMLRKQEVGGTLAHR